MAGCSLKRPVLYPNQQLIDAGYEVVQYDIDHCMTLADQYGMSKNRAADVAGKTVEGGATGGATGAAVGVVRGGAGSAAAAGAAGGGVRALIRGMRRARDPDPLFKRFVEICLRGKGYQPIGWR